MKKRKDINYNTHIIDLVVNNYSTASIFSKYGIDYCFNKNLNIKKAAEEKKIDVVELKNEIQKILDSDNSEIENYSEWDLLTLGDYLFREQHANIQETIVQINEILKEITDEARDVVPIIEKISILFQQLSEKIRLHINREDRMIFPLIKYLIDCKYFKERPKRQGYGTITKIINNMGADHQSIFNIMDEVRILTKNYTVLEGRGNNNHNVLQKLKQFEQDLFKVFHLENNILFPKACALENELTRL